VAELVLWYDRETVEDRCWDRLTDRVPEGLREADRSSVIDMVIEPKILGVMLCERLTVVDRWAVGETDGVFSDVGDTV